MLGIPYRIAQRSRQLEIQQQRRRSQNAANMALFMSAARAANHSANGGPTGSGFAHHPLLIERVSGWTFGSKIMAISAGFMLATGVVLTLLTMNSSLDLTAYRPIIFTVLGILFIILGPLVVCRLLLNAYDRRLLRESRHLADLHRSTASGAGGGGFPLHRAARFSRLNQQQAMSLLSATGLSASSGSANLGGQREAPGVANSTSALAGPARRAELVFRYLLGPFGSRLFGRPPVLHPPTSDLMFNLSAAEFGGRMAHAEGNGVGRRRPGNSHLQSSMYWFPDAKLPSYDSALELKDCEHWASKFYDYKNDPPPPYQNAMLRHQYAIIRQNHSPYVISSTSRSLLSGVLHQSSILGRASDSDPNLHISRDDEIIASSSQQQGVSYANYVAEDLRRFPLSRPSGSLLPYAAAGNVSGMSPSPVSGCNTDTPSSGTTGQTGFLSPAARSSVGGVPEGPPGYFASSEASCDQRLSTTTVLALPPISMAADRVLPPVPPYSLPLYENRRGLSSDGDFMAEMDSRLKNNGCVLMNSCGASSQCNTCSASDSCVTSSFIITNPRFSTRLGSCSSSVIIERDIGGHLGDLTAAGLVDGNDAGGGLVTVSNLDSGARSRTRVASSGPPSGPQSPGAAERLTRSASSGRLPTALFGRNRIHSDSNYVSRGDGHNDLSGQPTFSCDLDDDEKRGASDCSSRISNLPLAQPVPSAGGLIMHATVVIRPRSNRYGLSAASFPRNCGAFGGSEKGDVKGDSSCIHAKSTVVGGVGCEGMTNNSINSMITPTRVETGVATAAAGGDTSGERPSTLTPLRASSGVPECDGQSCNHAMTSTMSVSKNSNPCDAVDDGDVNDDGVTTRGRGRCGGVDEQWGSEAIVQSMRSARSKSGSSTGGFE